MGCTPNQRTSQENGCYRCILYTSVVKLCQSATPPTFKALELVIVLISKTLQKRHRHLRHLTHLRHMMPLSGEMTRYDTPDGLHCNAPSAWCRSIHRCSLSRPSRRSEFQTLRWANLSIQNGRTAGMLSIGILLSLQIPPSYRYFEKIPHVWIYGWRLHPHNWKPTAWMTEWPHDGWSNVKARNSTATGLELRTSLSLPMATCVYSIGTITGLTIPSPHPIAAHCCLLRKQHSKHRLQPSWWCWTGPRTCRGTKTTLRAKSQGKECKRGSLDFFCILSSSNQFSRHVFLICTVQVCSQQVPSGPDQFGQCNVLRKVGDVHCQLEPHFMTCDCLM